MHTEFKKFNLVINSHSLSQFQTCETSYAYSELYRIKPPETKKSFAKGTEFGRILNVIHWRIKKFRPKGFTELKNILYPVFKDERLTKRWGNLFPFDEAMVMRMAVTKYIQAYDFSQFRPIGIETGFSKVLYEDLENRFVYEGRPDIIIQTQDNTVMVGDNKTQSMKYSIYQFNNQAMGYLWAMGATNFFYNYILFNKDPLVRRETFGFSPSQIEAWKEETVRWCFRIKRSLESGEFLQCRSSCQTKYGLCDYVKLCEQSNENVRAHIMKTEFKQVPIHKSW